jgi:hypothetical protein
MEEATRWTLHLGGTITGLSSTPTLARCCHRALTKSRSLDDRSSSASGGVDDEDEEEDGSDEGSSPPGRLRYTAKGWYLRRLRCVGYSRADWSRLLRTAPVTLAR